LNTFSKILTYFSRSNTDVTSLLSGTAVKAVVSYVSDYIAKLGLKTYQAFASVFDIFDRNADTLNSGAEGVEVSRTLMRQMINSMSTKMEIGSPMAAMYILGNPDHYPSHKYVNFAWRSYVTFVKSYWNKGIMNDGDVEDEAFGEDFLTIQNQSGSYVACSIVDDYRFRPTAYDNVNLYEWVQCSAKKVRTRKERQEFEEQLEISKSLSFDEADEEIFEKEIEPNDSDSDFSGFTDDDISSDGDGVTILDDTDDWNSDDEDAIIVQKNMEQQKAHIITSHPFLPVHKAAFRTHSVHCDFSKLDKIIPNFIGGAIPRSDKGDREYYCMSIMTLFKPWRQPSDLKDNDSTWDQVFHEHTFTGRQKELIRNFNIRYECNDARDDHYNVMRRKMAEQGEYRSHPILGSHDKFENDVEAGEFGDEDMGCDDDITVGRRTDRLDKSRAAIRAILQGAKWLDVPQDGLLDIDTTRFFAPYKTRQTWAGIMKSERQLYTANKMSDMPAQNYSSKRPHTADKVEVVPYDYLTPKSKLTQEANDTLVHDICNRLGKKFNKEQERAFRIVAAHASNPQSSPLKMYMGGMGGSGKSAVFNAIVEFFTARKEEYRFLVLGPTGSTAALLNGSTYHSVFRIPREGKSKNRDDVDGISNDTTSIAAINERLQGVEYILLDELSMVSCEDLQLLASQAAKARNVHDVEFGNLNVIFAGDFAQLPPVTGRALYNGSVSLRTTNTMSAKDQSAVLGRILWHQFTTVVLLRQNMRQKSQTKDDAKLRVALENMRFGACTPKDIDFLRTRVASDRPGHPHLDTKKFRNVSVITGLNIHKDVINEEGVHRFAQDTGQELVEFYSVDKLTSRAVDKWRWPRCAQAHFKQLNAKLQHALWSAPPTTVAEQIPGCLKLCVGMPVMIKSNDATEICVTKGQEAVVVGWDSSTGPSGQKILDTLFVRLVKPP
jgi:hypothetical protein